MIDYKTFFGFERDVFSADIPTKDIMETQSVKGIVQRFKYAVEWGGIALVTGAVGSGKSTTLRYASSLMNKTEYRMINVIANSGTILEFYRQTAMALDIRRTSNSKSLMTHLIKKEIEDLVISKKIKPILVVDEASLLRLDVFAEMHTLCQFVNDSKRYLPIILTGFSNLIDKLSYRDAAPLASRVIARIHLEGLEPDELNGYLCHHLRIAGVNANLFDESAIESIFKASSGALRAVNHLARGALIAAAMKNSRTVTAQDVKLAGTELLLT